METAADRFAVVWLVGACTGRIGTRHVCEAKRASHAVAQVKRTVAHFLVAVFFLPFSFFFFFGSIALELCIVKPSPSQSCGCER